MVHRHQGLPQATQPGAMHCCESNDLCFVIGLELLSQGAASLQGLLICEVAAFTADRCVEGAHAVAAASNMAQQWAEAAEAALSVEQQSGKSTGPGALTHQCALAHMLAVTCHGFTASRSLPDGCDFDGLRRPLSAADVDSICLHMVMAHHRCVCSICVCCLLSHSAVPSRAL